MRSRGPVRSRKKDTLDHFRRFASTLKLIDDETGLDRPFELEDWELEVAADFFAGFTETLAEVPSGSGKTTFFASVGLHHGTYVARDCRAIIMSSSGKQAKQMYNAAAGFIDRSPDLSRWWAAQEYGLGRIKSLTDRGVIEIMAPSPKSVEGDIPSLLLGDELHRYVDDGTAYSILLSKLQKRGARVLSATTAGEDDQSFLGRKRALALQGSGMKVSGHLVPELRDQEATASELGGVEVRAGEYYTVARDADGVIAYHEWSQPEGHDPDDFEDVKRANPSSFVTVGSLRQTWKLLRARPWDWLRQHCNRWTLGETSAIDAAAYRQLGDPAVGPLEDQPFWLGLDMGGVSDSTAIIPVWRDVDDEDGKPRFVSARGQIVWPPGDGEWTLLDDVRDALAAALELPGTFSGLVFDQAKGGGYIAQEIARLFPTVDVIDHGQAAEMDDASELLARMVVEGRLRHDVNPEVDRQVLGAAAKRSRRSRWYLAKPSSQKHRKIDAAVALAMALRIANDGEQGSMYDDPDAII